MVGKCLASMLTMYWQSRDVLLKEESPTLAASVVETNSKSNSTSKVRPKQPNKGTQAAGSPLYSFSEGRLGKGGRDPAPRQRGGERRAWPQDADRDHSRIIGADEIEMDVLLMSDSAYKLTHLVGE